MQHQKFIDMLSLFRLSDVLNWDSVSVCVCAMGMTGENVCREARRARESAKSGMTSKEQFWIMNIFLYVDPLLVSNIRYDTKIFGVLNRLKRMLAMVKVRYLDMLVEFRASKSWYGKHTHTMYVHISFCCLPTCFMNKNGVSSVCFYQ